MRGFQNLKKGNGRVSIKIVETDDGREVFEAQFDHLFFFPHLFLSYDLHCLGFFTVSSIYLFISLFTCVYIYKHSFSSYKFI